MSRDEADILDVANCARGSSVPRSAAVVTTATRPSLVAHADWGVAPTKRLLARAELGADGRYVARAPEPVGESTSLLRRLGAVAGAKGVIFVGFDFPIGLPLAYAERVGIQDFVAALPEFGSEPWAEFYTVATTRTEIGLKRPFYPYRPGGTSRTDLVMALGVADFDELRRRCERKQAHRSAACPLFWTLGGNQVGKGAIHGWRDILGPALEEFGQDLALWPFDGPLQDLFRPGRVVVAETYPAEVYRQLGIDLSRSGGPGGAGKRSTGSRAINADAMVAWATGADVTLDDKLVEMIENGFGPHGDGEDPFDAVVGLFGMLNVVLGKQEPGEPTDERVRRVEGWILGQPKA
jgi:hypothetical protein